MVPILETVKLKNVVAGFFVWGDVVLICVPKLFWKCSFFIAFLVLIWVPITASAVLVNVTGEIGVSLFWQDPFVADLNAGAPFTIDVAPDGSFSLPASVYNATGSIAYPVTGFSVVSATVVAHNLNGSFAPGNNPAAVCPGGGNHGACVNGGGFGGNMRILGRIAMYDASGALVSTVPLSMLGEALPDPVTSANSATLWGNAWTTRMAMVSGVTGIPPTSLGHAWDDGTNVGSNILLVTPGYYRNDSLSSDGPLLSSLSLTIVPEPGTALLLGSGILGLVAVGRRRSS